MMCGVEIFMGSKGCSNVYFEFSDEDWKEWYVVGI